MIKCLIANCGHTFYDLLDRDVHLRDVHDMRAERAPLQVVETVGPKNAKWSVISTSAKPLLVPPGTRVAVYLHPGDDDVR